MGTFKIKKGLNLPINGEPKQEIETGQNVTRVALLGEDYIGLKPTMLVKVGDKVKLGQLLFTDKKMPAIKYTAPGTGTVVEINRGSKRAFLSLVIELDGDEEVTFTSYKPEQIESLDKEKVISQLIESGLWTTLRARPFGRVSDPETQPHSLFVTAMDTNPLAPSVEKIINENKEQFVNGLKVLSKLTEGKVYLCKSPGAQIPVMGNGKISVEEFAGPHPAGNVGTHIHLLDPVGRHKAVWHIDAQEVIGVGYLFTTGRLNVERIVSLAGPGVKNPRLLKTRIGASVEELTDGERGNGDSRVISGSVIYGHTAAGATDYLGRFSQQISVISESRGRVLFRWLNSGFKVYSAKNITLSKLLSHKRFNFDTYPSGSPRAVVPVGSYEKVMPMDILPSYLLRALAVDDVEEAEKLGCLELVEEDLALCTFVCPSKIDHAVNLRRNLTLIEKEG